MIRDWAAVALLAVSWLLGIQYYHEADWFAWVAVVLAGAALLARTLPRTPSRRAAGLAAALLLPALALMPWPYRMGALLLVVGLTLWAAPIPSGWPKAIGSAAVLAGVILLGQALAIEAYAEVTARSHELPWPLPQLLAAIGTLLGMVVAADRSVLALWSMRLVNPLGATWELFLDPPTFCFLVGGILLIAVRVWADAAQAKWRARVWRPVVGFVVAVALWLPVRTGLLLALYLHRLLRTEYDDRLNLMTVFWSPWVPLLFLVPPVFLAWRFARLSKAEEGQPAAAPAPEEAPPPAARAPRLWRCLLAALLAGAAVAALTVALFWDPVGSRKGGRVLVDEFHSTWEPTQKPYDTEWYGQDSGYNYACIYDYCSRFYDMGRLRGLLNDAILEDCDVLILKVPNAARYGPDEIEAVHRFVARGGGVLLVGEHTDVFCVNTHLNDVAQAFGVTFRSDCCFGVDSVFEELYNLPLVPHPVMQHMPYLDFEISCSVAPGLSGRTLICGTGLWSLPAEYHASNFYPQVEYRPDLRTGAFAQLWATRYGKGRVVAFTDSTQPSNFSAFEPGKAELVLGMIEWLNHGGGAPNPRWLLVPLGLVLLAAAGLLARGWDAAWLVLLAAGTLGWTGAVCGVRAAHRAAMPPPKSIRPLTLVVMDRTITDSFLPRSGFIGGRADGFGIFERWILRLAYFTTRQSGADAFRGDLLIFFYPNQRVTPEFRDQVVRYVDSGGKVLVLDSPENAKSTANSLLWPFGLARKAQTNVKGALKAPEGWPSAPIDAAWEVTGGQPLMHVAGKTVAATVRHGKGTVTLIGFGSRFADNKMGVTGDIVPDASMRAVYDLQFKLLRAIVSDTLPAGPLPPATKGARE